MTMVLKSRMAEVGELLIRGKNVFAGYWNDPEATEESLVRPAGTTPVTWMRRGDGDDLWFVSRKKDIIIRGGTNISPVEVEEALVAAHPAVEEAAVVGHTRYGAPVNASSGSSSSQRERRTRSSPKSSAGSRRGSHRTKSPRVSEWSTNCPATRWVKSIATSC